MRISTTIAERITPNMSVINGVSVPSVAVAVPSVDETKLSGKSKVIFYKNPCVRGTALFYARTLRGFAEPRAAQFSH